MATELEFTKNEGVWKAEVVSPGSPIAVEVNRSAIGPFLVKGSISGMAEVLLKDFGPGAYKDLLFEIDVPEGINLCFTSYTEVISAKIEGL